ncbi:hypothetical protein Ahy_B03g062371 [Arachis hypogaea]|uniref:Uncharacterized protein n=1 Tax=Arachis hypogaea TaxID=3818 RepID=A0A444ZTX9_ARAHY|nr:hypothetical protein Ahy_B03g062371 [Arachis hypogaea]
MLDDVRHGWAQWTDWLRPDIKKALSAHWETDDGFRHLYLTNRANRASSRSFKYTGNSTTFMKAKLKSLDRDAILAEMFKYTHMLKENKARCADQRLRTIIEEDAADGSTASVVNPDVVWRKTASTMYKNRVYGMESLFDSSLCTSLRLSSGSAASRAIQSEDGVNLRLQVQELQCSLHQQAHECNDYRERYQEIFTCVTSTDELILEFRESMEWIQRMKA